MSQLTQVKETIIELTKRIEKTDVFKVVEFVEKDDYGLLLFVDSDKHYDIASFVLLDNGVKDIYFLNSEEHFSKIPSDWLNLLKSYTQVEKIITQQEKARVKMLLEDIKNPDYSTKDLSTYADDDLIFEDLNLMYEDEIEAALGSLYLNSHCFIDNNEELYSVLIKTIQLHEHFSKYKISTRKFQTNKFYIGLVGKPAGSY